MSDPSPSILVAMPLYQGWEHVGATLETIRRQTYRNFRVLISVDGNDRRSYEACEPYMDDPRFARVLQSEHLDWHGNMTWLGGQLAEDFFCYWQHDDHCDPEYLETLVEHAVRHPEAASIYCDMQMYGERDRLVELPSVTGFALERVLRQLTHYDPAAIRCLVRADAMRAALPITVVSTWCMAVARTGELHRVPKLMYHRHIRQRSLTFTLRERPKNDLWWDGLEWCLGALQNLSPLVPEDEALRLFAIIVDMAVIRQVRHEWQFDFSQVDRAEQVRFVREFLEAAEERFGLSPYGAAEPEERRRGGALFDGEDLLLEAVLGPGRDAGAGQRSGGWLKRLWRG